MSWRNHDGRLWLVAAAAVKKTGLSQILAVFLLCANHELSFLICRLVIVLFCVCLKIFEQFVKTRIKEEYKEKKSKLLLAKEEFKKLLEESKLSPRYGERVNIRQFLGLEIYRVL